MIDNLTQDNIRIFVFGTLRLGERLDFYMKGGIYRGLYFCEGQLMKSETGSAYIDIDCKNVATIGELYTVNYYCLQRINHLEAVSGEFPKAYDLDICNIWPYNPELPISFDKKKSEFAFFYKRRNNPIKILSGDWTKHRDPIVELGCYLRNSTSHLIKDTDLIKYMQTYLGH